MRGATTAPLRCPDVNHRTQHMRRDALETAVQVNPGRRSRAERTGYGVTGDADLHTRGLWYGWDMNGLGMEPPPDRCRCLGRYIYVCSQLFATGGKVRPQLASVCVCLSVHVLIIVNQTLGERRPNRVLPTPISLLRAIEASCGSSMLPSYNGRIKKQQRFVLVESGDTVLFFLLPWLTASTRQGDTKQRQAR